MEEQASLVPRRELQLRRLAEDDRFLAEAEIVGFAHAVAADFFADDKEEGYVCFGDFIGREKLLHGLDLRGYAAFGVDAASAPYLVIFAGLVRPVRGDGIDVA